MEHVVEIERVEKILSQPDSESEVKAYKSKEEPLLDRCLTCEEKIEKGKLFCGPYCLRKFCDKE